MYSLKAPASQTKKVLNPLYKIFKSNYIYISKGEAVQIKTIEISSCLKMGISLFFFFLFMRLFAEINGGSQDDECKASRCSHHGPVIRFPFRLKHQPEHCGYPEFELSCSEEKLTILELPYSGKLWVKEINYVSQEIVVHYSDDCLQRQILNFNLSASPFTYE